MTQKRDILNKGHGFFLEKAQCHKQKCATLDTLEIDNGLKSLWLKKTINFFK